MPDLNFGVAIREWLTGKPHPETLLGNISHARRQSRRDSVRRSVTNPTLHINSYSQTEVQGTEAELVIVYANMTNKFSCKLKFLIPPTQYV